MGIEQKKNAMQEAIDAATQSVDTRMGGAYDRDLDKKFLASLRGQMKKRAESGKPLTGDDLSEGERARLRKIAEMVPDLTDEELDVVSLASSKKKEQGGK